VLDVTVSQTTQFVAAQIIPVRQLYIPTTPI